MANQDRFKALFVNSESMVKQNILINEEFRSFIPPLQQAEKEQLEQNILAEGCREPLIIWSNGKEYILIDGHNRYEICQKNKIDFKYELKNFVNEDEVKVWMLNNQLGRRNLTDEQKSYLRGKRYETQKAQGKRNDLTFGQNVQRLNDSTSGYFDQKLENITSGQNVQTSVLMGQEEKVSEKTIRRDAQFAKGIDLIGKENPELKKEILSGKVKINKNQIQALAKMESFPKIESLDQIADILQVDKPAKEKVKTDLEIAKEKLIKVLQNKKLTVENLAEMELLFKNLRDALKFD